jgi:glyoxylase-like metal-dependent hydrolase (beta-lactamase superfamily II)
MFGPGRHFTRLRAAFETSKSTNYVAQNRLTGLLSPHLIGIIYRVQAMGKLRAEFNLEASVVMNPDVTAFFDPQTNTITYVVRDPHSQAAAIIDPVLDYDPKAGRTSTTSADKVIAYVREQRLEIRWILETHAHADHLTAAPYLKDALGGQSAIGKHIVTVQETFKALFNAEGSFQTNGSQFDVLLAEDDTFDIGALKGRVMHTPGHTPACSTYVIGDAAFVGDTLFMPDYGTARCDFPGGDAATLYRSIQRLFALPSKTRLFMCHDYLPVGRQIYRWETTVAEEKVSNIHFGTGHSETDFVKMRIARDATLEMPVLLLPSVQVNMRAGNLPPPEGNGVSYLKIPVNAL